MELCDFVCSASGVCLINLLGALCMTVWCVWL